MWIKRFQRWLTFGKVLGPNHWVVSDVSERHKAVSPSFTPEGYFLINCFPSQICFYFLGFAFQRNASTKAREKRLSGEGKLATIVPLLVPLPTTSDSNFLSRCALLLLAGIVRCEVFLDFLHFLLGVFPLSARSGLFDFVIRNNTSFKSHKIFIAFTLDYFLELWRWNFESLWDLRIKVWCV